MRGLGDFKYLVLTDDKVPQVSFRATKTLENVEQYANHGIKVESPFVVLDVDSGDEFETMLEIVKSLNVNCNIMRTTRGGHFWFKSAKPLTNNIKIQTPIGISVDIRSHGKNSLVVTKSRGVNREWLVCDDFDSLDAIPFWLLPNTGYKERVYKLHNGEGRNPILFSYIIQLHNAGLTRNQIVAIFSIINDYVLADKLPKSELDTILREESFSNLKPHFYQDKKLMHNVFGDYFLDKYQGKYHNELLHIYDKGVYTADRRTIERHMTHEIPVLKTAQINEIMSYCTRNADDAVVDRHKILLKNGIYDTETNQFMVSNPDYFMTNQVNAEYRPEHFIIPNKLVDKVFSDLACGDQDVVQLFYEMIGYCLTSDVSLQKAFILVGEGSNGKSTFLDTVKHLLGHENISAVSLQELSARFKGAALVNKLANIGDDISAKYMDESSNFKLFTTGETVTVERKGQDPFDFNNTAKLIYSANELPQVRDRSAGLMRRLVIIPFNATFGKGNPTTFNPHIGELLREPEQINYILGKSLQALNTLRVNKAFTQPTIVEQAVESFKEDNDHLVLYLKGLDVQNFLGLSDKEVYLEYTFWCNSEANQPVSKAMFTKRIKAMLPITLKQFTEKGKPVRRWVTNEKTI